MAKEISFEVSSNERDLIERISARALNMGLQGRIGRRSRSRMDVEMDVTAVHANGNPLRLADLLDADDFNFTHDICGIRDCLDRETGELTDFFSPRFSRRDKSEAA